MALLLDLPPIITGRRSYYQDSKLRPDLKDEHEHYYNRLLVTEDMLYLDPAFDPLDESPVVNTTPHPEVPDEWSPGYYFGDGSGGTYSSYDFLRRCGVGVHYVDPDLTPGFNAWQPLCGPVRTVPRSELTACVTTVQTVTFAVKIDFFTDSLITKNTYYKGLARAGFAANSDLWSVLFATIADKQLDFNIYWMPSHSAADLKKKAKAPSWIKDWHVKGKDKADSCADTAAALQGVPRDRAAPLIKILDNLSLFQERHIAISKQLPQRNRNTKVIKETAPTKEFRIMLACTESSHNCIPEDSRIYCTECGISVSMSAPHVFDVPQSPCLSSNMYPNQ